MSKLNRTRGLVKRVKFIRSNLRYLSCCVAVRIDYIGSRSFGVPWARSVMKQAKISTSSILIQNTIDFKPAEAALSLKILLYVT